jgi:hypothetical protein
MSLGPNGHEVVVTYPFPALVMQPTVFSGLELDLELKTVVTASDWAAKRVGW